MQASLPSTTILNLSGTFIILMLAITVADVFGKGVLNLPFKGSLEIISYYCMIGSVFLALPYVTLKRGTFHRILTPI